MSAQGPTVDQQQHQLPQSHGGRLQHRNKNKQDPFWDLSDEALKQSMQPPTPTPTNNSEDPSNPLIADLVLTPISVISFVLSWFVVERQHRQWRLSNQSRAAPSKDGWFANPEPYQEAAGTTWHPRLSWKRRGIAKLQLSEVLEMRGRVVLGLALWVTLGVWACFHAIWHLYSWTFA